MGKRRKRPVKIKLGSTGQIFFFFLHYFQCYKISGVQLFYLEYDEFIMSSLSISISPLPLSLCPLLCIFLSPLDSREQLRGEVEVKV